MASKIQSQLELLARKHQCAYHHHEGHDWRFGLVSLFSLQVEYWVLVDSFALTYLLSEGEEIVVFDGYLLGGEETGQTGLNVCREVDVVFWVSRVRLGKMNKKVTVRSWRGYYSGR